jgi:hypothetical protein
MECLLHFRIKAAIDGRPVLTRQRLLAASATAELCDIRAASTPQNDESSWSRTDHCTSPICSAVLPSTMSQPRTMRFAVAIPHNLASRCAPSAPGIRPNARLRQSEQGAMARHTQIAGQSKLKASAQGRARNFRQRHDRQRLNAVEYVLHSLHMGHKLLASSRTGEERIILRSAPALDTFSELRRCMIAQPEPATSSSTLYQASTNSASKGHAILIALEHAVPP